MLVHEEKLGDITYRIYDSGRVHIFRVKGEKYVRDDNEAPYGSDEVVDEVWIEAEQAEAMGLVAPKKSETVSFICSECHSSDVEVKMWVNPNNNKIGGDAQEDVDQAFCNNCEKHQQIMEEADLESKFLGHKP